MLNALVMMTKELVGPDPNIEIKMRDELCGLKTTLSNKEV